MASKNKETVAKEQQGTLPQELIPSGSAPVADTMPPAIVPPAQSSPLVALARDYPLLANAGNLRKIVAANMGGQRLRAFDLERIKMPSGGIKSWTTMGLEGEQMTTAIFGIILYWKSPRAYWQIPFAESGGGTPPDCSSDNGDRGKGSPGGDCGSCPLAQFGSARRANGTPAKGQACKQMRLLFLLRPGNNLPDAVFLPPTSIEPMQKYFLRLTSMGVPYFGVVTSLALTDDKSEDGIKYSKVVPSVAKRLSGEEVMAIKSVAQSMRAMMEGVMLDAEDFRTVQ